MMEEPVAGLELAVLGYVTKLNSLNPCLTCTFSSFFLCPPFYFRGLVRCILFRSFMEILYEVTSVDRLPLKQWQELGRSQRNES